VAKFGVKSKIKYIRCDSAKEFGKVDSGMKLLKERPYESVDMITHYLIGNKITKYAEREGINLIQNPSINLYK
jgi:hypothetical protein